MAGGSHVDYATDLLRRLARRVWPYRRSAVVLRQIELSRQLNDELKSTVQHGPFKGLKLPKDIWWGKTDRGSMLLGMYEEEILTQLTRLPTRYNRFINVGAADGYYGVGVLVANMFRGADCFEISKDARAVIAATAASNGVASRLVIHGAAEPGFLDMFSEESLSESVLLIDVEGAEYELLCDSALEKLSESIVIVELHTGLVEDGEHKTKSLVARAERYFSVTVLESGARNPNALKELRAFCDTDRWLVVSESRPYPMQWLRLDPLSRGAVG
jgi:hypothetical protein